MHNWLFLIQKIPVQTGENWCYVHPSDCCQIICAICISLRTQIVFAFFFFFLILPKVITQCKEMYLCQLTGSMPFTLICLEPVQMRAGQGRTGQPLAISHIKQIISAQLSGVRPGIMCNINCLSKQMKYILRKHSIRAPAPSFVRKFSAVVRPLMKVNGGLHHRIMGSGMSAFTKEMRGV